jgi:Cytochrome c554 and c-prime
LICGWLASARPSKEPAMELLSRDVAIIESESRANSNSFGAGLVQLKQLLAEKSPGQVNSAQDLGNADRTAMSQEIAARLSDLPSGCLSGLEGLDLTGIPKVDIDAETARIRRIVEGNPDHTLSNRPSEFDGHSIPARPIRSLPDVNEVDRPGEPTIQTTSFETPYNPHANATETSSGDGALDAISRLYAADGRDPHADVFQESMFPSATQCAKCHEQIYDEWASSGHAYASISPMFTRFEDTINELSQGTIGYFCLRCHAPVATTVGLRRDQPIWDGPRVLREGVTCIACHRVKENYTKANGERRIEPGDMFDPVYSGSGEIGTQVAAKYKDFFKVKTSPGDSGPGQPLHNRAIEFEQLSQSDFCMSCHLGPVPRFACLSRRNDLSGLPHGSCTRSRGRLFNWSRRRCRWQGGHRRTKTLQSHVLWAGLFGRPSRCVSAKRKS